MCNGTETQQNKQLVLEHYRSTVSDTDFAAIQQQLSHDFVDHESPSGTPAGPEWVKRHVTSFHTAFPDIRVEVHELIAERDLVTARATWSGTHQGDYMGFPATHRSFRLKGIVIWRVREGRITERWACVDRLGLMQQLGLTVAQPAYDYEQRAPCRLGGDRLKKAAWMLVVGALLWPIGAFALFPIVGGAYSSATVEGRRAAIQSHTAIWALQQVIFLSGAALVGFGEINLERFYRDSRNGFAKLLSKAMVGLMGLGLIGFAASAATFVLNSVSPVDNPLLIYWKIATWCILVSFGLLSLLRIGKNIATNVVSIVCISWVLLSAYSFVQMGKSFPPLLLFLVPLAMGLRLLMHVEPSQ